MSGKVSRPPRGVVKTRPVSGKVSAPPPPLPPPGGTKPPRPLTSAHPLTTIAIPGLNGGRVWVEVGGEGVGRSDWVVGDRMLRTYKVITNTHATINVK